MIFKTFDSSGGMHVMDAKGLFHGVPAAFLVGGAPSLREQNYGLLEQRGVLTFAMNNVGSLFRPTCMVASDEPACFDRRLLFDPTIMKFLWYAHDDREIEAPDGTKKRLHDLPNAFLFDVVMRKRDSALLSDSTSVDWKRNTFFLGISVMYHLGIRTIVVAGSDFESSNGRDYANDASLSEGEKGWNDLLYKYEIADMVRLAPVFESYGLTIYDTSLHGKICKPAGPYEKITLEQGVEMCLKGVPEKHDADLPHVSRLQDPGMMDRVLSGRYTYVDEKEVLSDAIPSKGDVPGSKDQDDKEKAMPVAPL